VLAEMLSGIRPFHRDSAIETMNAILKEDPPDPSVSNSRLPAFLDRVVRHCLEKNPAERFQSAQDLAFALQSSATSGAGTAGSAMAIEHARPARWERLRSARIAWPLAAILLMSTVALSARLFLPRPSDVSAAPIVRLEISVPESAAIALAPGVGLNPLALSPDGRQLAFVASVDGTPHLWLRSLDSLTAGRINGTEGGCRSVLVAGQPLDRVLRRRQAEAREHRRW